MYALLVDLSDAVAEAVQLPVDGISMEMVWRGLYHFNKAYNRGLATDPVAYLAGPLSSFRSALAIHGIVHLN